MKDERAAEPCRPDMSDEDLLAEAQAGDDAAFHELTDRHAQRLFRLAFSLVGGTVDAEDVVQETLLGAFEHIRKFEGRSSVKTWLTSILMRQAARHHRRRSRSRETWLANGDHAAPGRGGGVREASDRRLDVRRALGRLSADHRQVVVLREYDGMSYAEMAEVLGVPQGTVESRLHRARQELKDLLRDYLP